jgi:hypothetical protein
MFEQLGSNDLEGPVTTDIAGKSDAWAIRLDREASDEIKKARLHQKVATTILFESNGGQTKHRASVPEIKAAVGSPDLLLPNVDTVLEEMVRSCYYLSQDGNYYKFSLNPNLNKILTDRRAAVPPTAIEQRLKKEIETVFKAGPKGIDLDRRYWPAKTNDVPDRPELTLVVMAPETPVEDRKTLAWMEQITKECGSSGRTMKSALIFVVPEASGNLAGAVRDVLAWEEIEDDEDTKKRLDESQKKQLVKGIGRAKADLKEAIWRSYRHLYFLDKNNTLKETDLGQITSSMATSMVELVVNRLVKDDEITEGVGSHRLLKYWPPALDKWSTKGVRDAFYSSPALPRLLKANSVRRTIADGVTQRLFGYARENDAGGVKLERAPGESMSESDVEISDDVFLLKAADAQKLLEPPRLARIKIVPEYVTVNVGEKATFSASGVDQYDQPFDVAAVEWEATGGLITASGEFTAGDDAGAFTVKARTAGIEGSAQIRVVKSTEPGVGPGPGLAGKATLRWSGTIPPQKWMNFYTKVVSRYASDSDLRLTVGFEVPVDADQAASREQDARAALRELGLDEDVSIS